MFFKQESNFFRFHNQEQNYTFLNISKLIRLILSAGEYQKNNQSFKHWVSLD